MKWLGMLAILLMLLSLGAAGYWLFKNAVEDFSTVPPSGMVEIVGEIVCLPHRNQNGPQTMECAYGLMDENNLYYQLRFDDSQIDITVIPTNTFVKVNGNFTISKEGNYDTVGYIEVESVTVNETGEVFPKDEIIESDGVISVTVPQNYSLGVTGESFLLKSYIPPCAEGYLYCIYYSGTKYSGTNFDSAGLAITKRDDLRGEDRCLSTVPLGYASSTAMASSSAEGYSISVYPGMGDAGAGHFANEEEYRLYAGEQCYGLRILVGESQFANYPVGSIDEFTVADRNNLMTEIRGIIKTITLVGLGSEVILPMQN